MKKKILFNLGKKFMKFIFLRVSMRGCDCVGVGISADIVLGGGGVRDRWIVSD